MSLLRLGFVIVLANSGILQAVQEEGAQAQLSHLGSFLTLSASQRGHLVRTEGSKAQAEITAKPKKSATRDRLPLCKFTAKGNFSRSVNVFVAVDNTREFAFDGDNRSVQSKVQCHGATPDVCTKAHLLPSGEPDSCEKYSCDCVQATLSQQTIHMNHVKQMVSEAGPMCTVDGGAKILHIGLGGGALSSYLLDNCAQGTKVTSVESDPRVIAVAKQFFGLRTVDKQHTVENLDAGEAVRRHASAGDKYDIVLIDCAEAGGNVPDSCGSQAFVKGVRSILRPNGKAIQQVRESQYSDLRLRYSNTFGYEHLNHYAVGAQELQDSSQYLLIASQSDQVMDPDAFDDFDNNA